MEKKMETSFPEDKLADINPDEHNEVYKKSCYSCRLILSRMKLVPKFLS